MKDIVERFISYTGFDTTSHEDTDICPSNPDEFLLARKLKEELEELGLQDVCLDDKCFVYGLLPSNMDGKAPTVGFLAHMDTSDAASGHDVKARIIEKYDGKDIKLSDTMYTRVADFPELKNFTGKSIIVTDGTTLLGADDKAGIAIIMDYLSKCVADPSIRHPNIRVCFTPDEEIGTGILNIDLNRFVCDYAYTLDGGAVNVVTYECFNAATAVVKFNGVSIHPGSAKGKMINACQLAMDFHGLLPVFDRPEFTEKREGFNHLLQLNGDCLSAVSTYIIRNHDLDLLHKQMKQFEMAAEYLNQTYGREVVSLDIAEKYHNMKECFNDKMYIIDNVAQCLKQMGYEVEFDPIRGGTDGSQLSFMGIPTPNLGTGGMNFHGNHELVCIDDMKAMVELLIRLTEKIAGGEE